ncbi:MAG: VCBS repeat-containing protein [Desulfamplus sp.]|nr:VCBS repeat-containing protein [Desulfamplus sp.]
MEKKKFLKFPKLMATVLTAIVLPILILFIPGAAAKEQNPLTIAVLPFEINTAQDFDFLKGGIQDMLNSRLSWSGRVKVLEKEMVNKVTAGIKGFSGESLALLAGGELQADFVIHGSVTIIGSSTSIDSKLVDISGKHEPIPFYQQAGDPGGVIPAINQFATTINETIFHRASVTLTSGDLSTQGGGASQNTFEHQSTPSGHQSTPFQHQSAPSGHQSTPFQHQSAPFQHQSIAQAPGSISQSHGSPSTRGQENLNPVFISQGQDRSDRDDQLLPNTAFTQVDSAGGSGRSVWKSPVFNHLINGIAVGDVTGDGRMETVIISDHSVFIYQFVNSRFVKIAEAANNKVSTFIGVDTGDINGNGIAEIFITSLAPENSFLSSFVLEYNGRDYSPLVRKKNWYFRVAKSQLHGNILLGQNQKRGADAIHSAPIYKMIWSGSDYTPGDQLLGPGIVNIMGAAIYDIPGEYRPAFIAYDRSDYLTLISASGKEIWRDAKSSGGSLNRFNLPKDMPADTNPIQFFPLRTVSADIDDDGMMEILYASNQDAALGILSKVRSLGKGFVTSAYWTGSAFSPQWTTPVHKGRITDFVIADFDNDGYNELVIAEVLKDSLTPFSPSESIVVAYRITR